jgi:hypothetical protein
MTFIPALLFACAAISSLSPSAAEPQKLAQIPMAGLTRDSLIRVGDDRPVRIGAAAVATVEPHLAANPRNPSHLVAGVILVQKSDLTETSCTVLTSFDAGRTWTRHDFPARRCADPWVVIHPDGSAVAAMLGDVEDDRAVLVFRSPDGGRTWSAAPVAIRGDHDHPTMALDTTRGPLTGSVYVVSQASARDAAGKRRPAASVARSTDAGATFSAPAHVIPGNLWMTAMNPAVLSDGTLVVPFSNFARSTSDGDYAWLDSELDWVVTSTDGGKMFSVPLFVSHACGRTFPVLAADGSQGPNRDRLYWLCNDRAFEYVYLHTSSNRGERWSDPIRVNRGSGRDPYVRTAAVAINRDGVLGISWYDARNDRAVYKGMYRCQELFFTASLDSGRTFLPEVKVSSGKNCPDTPANGEAGRRWPAGGDYHGLAAAADGRFHVLWADSREGIYQLRIASIHVDERAAKIR